MSFRWKTILGIALIEAVLLSILIFSSLNFLLTSNEEQLQQRAATAATLFSTVTKDAVLASDLASLESFAKEILKNPGLIYARVISNSEGKLVEVGDPQALVREFAEDKVVETVTDGIFDTFAEIREGNTVFGRVEVGISSAQIEHVLIGARHKTTTIAMLEILLTGIFSFVLGTYLTRHLKILKESSRRLAAGELGYQIMVRGKDELADTAQAFNDMSRNLLIADSKRKQAEQELKTLNEDLERRITLRTKDLALLNRQLKYQALHDPLTKLPNRMLFMDRMEQAIGQSNKHGSTLAAIMIDLNNFKMINDSMGHHVGDMVLQQFASRVQEALGDGDTFARIGGDEFIILIPYIDDKPDVIKLANTIVDSLKAPLSIDGDTCDVLASLGIAYYPEDGADPDTLIRNADIAMYAAKKGQKKIVEYAPELERGDQKRISLQNDLRRAIENEEIMLHYQPKVDFNEGTINGVNALARWNHPEYGLIMPDEFIALAEHAGLIKALTSSLVRIAIRDCARWRDMGIDLAVSVNLAGPNLQDPEFPDLVARLLEDNNLPHERLEFSISETNIMIDPVHSIENISRFHEMGVIVSITDFGSGYSYISYLKKLMIAKIKIDRAFVMDMLNRQDQAMIVRSIIDLAHSLGLKVIAEGVENERLWDNLRTLGCDQAIGFYMSKPVESDELIDWIHSRRGTQKKASPNS